ncbi:hypothetical protein B0H34DRAFT_798667 [Crassisporium funariophilum]|nr:hypothetical protein B0H34DRAFT_798667 [Crassisporium funariophilum]
MVRFTSSIVLAFAVVPALSLASQQYERTVAAADLYDRGFHDIGTALAIRDELEQLYGRELIDDIAERSPFGFGAILKIGKKLTHLGHHSHHDQQQQERREVEEIYSRALTNDIMERSPFGFGAILKIGKKLTHLGHHSHQQQQQERREVEEIYSRALTNDIEERSPFGFGAILKIGKKLTHLGHHSHHQQQQQERREVEEIDLLERDNEGLFARVFDDLYDDLD